MIEKKVCFVVMGFGKRTDHTTGRALDLNKTYRIIIKPAVERAGLKCIRADDILHSGTIDVPMYEHLLSADLVIADLSTYNVNAFYELGVRHALKPYTTILMAEDQFVHPFDVGHTSVLSYKHLGAGIDAEDAKEASDKLVGLIEAVLDKCDVDSPVYTTLGTLQAPFIETAAPSKTVKTESLGEDTFTHMWEAVEEAKGNKAYGTAKDILTILKQMKPADEYITQQLALVTYKEEEPSAVEALLKAREILWELDPTKRTDPETLGLWGTVHKHLWRIQGEQQYLNRAIDAYRKGFYVKGDFYTGINFAFMLNERSALDGAPEEERIADVVTARHVRKEVLNRCAEQKADYKRSRVVSELSHEDAKDYYWVKATQLEALIGLELDNSETYCELIDFINTNAPQSWMKDTVLAQSDRLRELLDKSPLRENIL